MNKIQRSAITLAQTFLNAIVVITLVALASLIGVGGAALWIYTRPLDSRGAGVTAASGSKAAVAENDARVLPKMVSMQLSSDSPLQLTPARYVPSESEIATMSESPRYTSISYDGGRQQAHLLVHTVLATSAPAPLNPELAFKRNVAPAPAGAIALSDPSSRYILNSEGRVVGIDGTSGPALDGRDAAGRITRMPPEVRVAAPVVVRKATPVEDENTSPSSEGSFNVQSELAREDDRPALKALPVARSARYGRPSMFGASDDFRAIQQ